MNTTIRSAGHQSRFKRLKRPDEVPRLAQWRANLTGLSQIHNLYFVAYGANIHVFEPHFPKQQLAEDPLLIFTSQPSSPGLTGYIDHGHPHFINNLIVQYLGTEEVVAVVRDDGDVDAFLVRHIVQAVEIRRWPARFSVHGDEIRPFFQGNVGISAWGLAIHAQARIVAVSSNAHEVSVFKFGLLRTDEGDGDESHDDLSEHESSRSTGRETDVSHQILNGECNIPYIAFCNTGDDPEGRWLLTTDISGTCRTMDLHELQTVHKFCFGGNIHNVGGGFDRNHAGWILMFLDRRSFQYAATFHDAVGLDDGESLPDIKREPTTWDLSKTVRRLVGQDDPFVCSHGNAPTNEEPSYDLSDSTPPTHVEDSDEESDGGAPLEIEIDIEERNSGDDDDDDYSDAQESAESDTQESAEPDSHSNERLVRPPHIIGTESDDSSSEVPIVDDADDPDDEMTEDTIPYNAYYSGETISHNSPKYHAVNRPFANNLPCPILHASMRDIYLLQPAPEPDRDAHPFNPPMLGFANPLRQRIQQDFDFLAYFQRLNMAAYIPCLGIVIIASQKGRAIVLALTKLSASTAYPDDMLHQNLSSPRQSSSARKWDWMNKTIYTMRVQCILPFANEERVNQRPFAPLHGIAVSPLQGHEMEENPGRWRLLLMYQDHTILSYEICRTKGQEAKMGSNGAVGVETVVV